MSRTISSAQALNEALSQEMERDETIFLLGEDIGVLGGRAKVTQGLLKQFGQERVIDAPLNEELFVGIAIGAAQMGLRPVIEFAHGSLPLLAAADIFRAGVWNWICASDAPLPIVIRVKSGEGVGPELSASIISMSLNFLGITVLAPSTPYQAKGLLSFALRTDKPIIIFEHVRLYRKSGEVPSDEYVFPFGKGEYRRNGKDVSIIAYSALTDLAELAAEELSKEKISTEILDLVSIKPLDKEKIVETAKKTGHVLILGDEPTGPVGLFANIYTVVKEEIPGAKVRFRGTKHLPIPFGKFQDYVLPSSEEVAAAVKSLLRHRF